MPTFASRMMSNFHAIKRLLVLFLLGSVLAACGGDKARDSDARADAGLSDAGDDTATEDVRESGDEDAQAQDVQEDAAGEDGASDADTPDSTDPVEPGEAIGELDLSFSAGLPMPGLFVGPTDLRSDGSALMLALDDAVLIAGRGRVKGEDAAMYAARLGESGLLDSTFGVGGVQTLDFGPPSSEILVLAGAIQADGKSLICGNRRGETLGRSDLVVARLNPDGSPDPTFGNDPQMPGRAYFQVPGDAPNSLCWTLKVLADDTILVGGQIGANNVITPLLMRLLPDKSLDADFGDSAETPGIWLHDMNADGAMLYAKIRELTVLEDRKILALIDAVDLRTRKQIGYLLRFHPNGRIDQDFAAGATHALKLELPNSASHEVFDFAVAPEDGRIFVVGKTQDASAPEQSRFFVHALAADGTVDADFAQIGTYILGGFDAAARAINLQTNGKILVTGSATTHPDPAFLAGELLVVRLLADGTLDESFAAQAQTPGVFVWDEPTYAFYAARAALDSRGRLVVAGSTPDDASLSPRGYSFVLRIK